MIADVTDYPLSQLISLAGRTAVVTGGARGIGLAIATRLAEAEAHVVIGDLDVKSATAAAGQLEARFERPMSWCALDVREEKSVANLAELAVDRHGGLDIWVNNAGVYPTLPLLELGRAEWDLVLDVNLRGTFYGAREAARQMIGCGNGGAIVNVGSTAGYRASGPGVVHYVASKHGVRGLTKSLAKELGPHGIRALAVAPVLTNTPGVEEQAAGWEAAGLGGVVESQAQRVPLGRLNVADDVARVVLFCVSDLSIMMTGTTLVVDGGDLVH